DRFWRFASPTQLRVVARPPDEHAATLRLWLAREYVEGVEITSITPEPSSFEAAPDRFVLEFPLAEPDATATVLLNLEPRKRWRLPGRLGVEGGDALSFSQFIHP